MVRLSKLFFLFILTLIISCGGKEEEKKEKIALYPKLGIENKESKLNSDKKEEAISIKIKASEQITLDNKGVGKIKSLKLDPKINEEMVTRGSALFKTNCTACHRVNKRFIGPSPKGIMKRRSPEWIMNMILNPSLMIEKDQCARDLLVEFNGAVMSNQNITEKQARDILEYFRTL